MECLENCNALGEAFPIPSLSYLWSNPSSVFVCGFFILPAQGGWIEMFNPESLNFDSGLIQDETEWLQILNETPVEFSDESFALWFVADSGYSLELQTIVL